MRSIPLFGFCRAAGLSPVVRLRSGTASRVLAVALVACAVGLSACRSARVEPAPVPNVVVLGIDGMDPRLLDRFVAAGKMPNFERLIATGSYAPLGTSTPPQSPVAWSNFITGMDPGGHGIFDFIHREHDSYMPAFSSAIVEAPSRVLRLGRWAIPISRGRVELLRRGEAFWQRLDTRNVPYIIFRIPANFPPVKSRGVSVSGMGTPDLLGTYGTFSFYTDDPAFTSLDVSGGRIFPVDASAERVAAEIVGPENSLRADRTKLKRPFVVYIDRENEAAKIVVGDRAFILKRGEWSDWVEIDFDVLGPLSSVSGICRFYLKGLSPHFQLYVTPININPADPALPLSNPPEFSKALYEKIGYFYTQGMPEDTKALEWGVFTDAEFIHQSNIVLDERFQMLDAVLDTYRGGLLFFYFSTVDQTTHMLWRNMDEKHPAHTPEAAKYKDQIEKYYAAMDSALGVVEARMPKRATLIVMSDHGFAPYYKQFNLNTWLYENGFLELRRPESIEGHPLFSNVFWRRTRAYGLGINGLYVNLRGREPQGVVRVGNEYDELLAELTKKLLAYRDPETGEPVVARVYRSDEVYHGEALAQAPDLIVGYKRGYRGSDESALGDFTVRVLNPNFNKWSGDHCMAFEEVPGVIVSNRPLAVQDPNLTDLSATILGLYGVSKAEGMVGRQLFSGEPAVSRRR